MSPLGFDAKKLYQFVAVRFKKTSAKVQEQALNWLQVRRVLRFYTYCFMKLLTLFSLKKSQSSMLI